MNTLEMNKLQHAQNALAALSLKHNADKAGAVGASGSSAGMGSLSNAARIAREQAVANAHDALAELVAVHEEEVAAAASEVSVEMPFEDEIEIRVGSRVVARVLLGDE